MRKRIACLLLGLLMMAMPIMLASCSGETELIDKAAPVYTLYCITSDSTTKEAIVKVEYEINRVLFYRIGSIVKLEFVTADEYLDLIKAKAEEVKEYTTTLDESGKKQSLVNTAVLTESAEKKGYTAMSGEAILDDLQDGIDIELECPRFDLFLITDYASYLKMAENNELTALDTVLSNEAKAIKSYVHSSFFNAAKVGNKTYGIPCNTIIGQYTYIVFNEEILEGITEIAPNIKQETLYDLEDLPDYLALVKKNYPDVVPLANTVTPPRFSFMFEDGFPSYVNLGGYVRSTYEDEEINKYFTMLASYEALGYFENNEGKSDESVPFAVKFVKGTEEEIQAYALEHNVKYNKYSNPIATSENSIDCIFAVSSLCPSSWVTNVMEILTELYTDDDLQNTLLYGIETLTYRLEDGQVVHISGEEDGTVFHYEMNPGHTGNCFIAYTDKDAGDSKDKWQAARDQNKEAEESKTIGFTYVPNKYEFGTIIVEGEEQKRLVEEPLYDEILWSIVEEYYNKLITGKAIEFDYAAESETAKETALQSIRESLEKTYLKRLQTEFTKDIKDEVIADNHDKYMAIALKTSKEEVMEKAHNRTYRNKLKNMIYELESENHPDYDDDQMDELIDTLLEDTDYVWDNFRYNLIPYIDDGIESEFNDLVDAEVEVRTEKVLNSAAFLKAKNEMFNSDEFKDELEYSNEVYVADAVNDALNEKISSLIKEYCAEMIAECEKALTEAIDAFVEEYVAASGLFYEEKIAAQLKVTHPDLALEANADKLADRVKKQMTFNETFADSTNDNKKESALKELIASDFPDLSEDDAKAKLSEMIKEFDEIYVPMYSDFFNAKALAFYKIGMTDKSQVHVFGKETDEPEEPSEEPGDDEPIAGADGKLYDTYYAFVLAVKIKNPYYAQFGAPQ